MQVTVCVCLSCCRQFKNLCADDTPMVRRAASGKLGVSMIGYRSFISNAIQIIDGDSWLYDTVLNHLHGIFHYGQQGFGTILLFGWQISSNPP